MGSIESKVELFSEGSVASFEYSISESQIFAHFVF